MNKAEIREALKSRGITSGGMLADYLNAKAVIFFVRGQQGHLSVGWGNARAKLRYWDEDGNEHTEVFRPEGPVDFGQQVRVQLVGAAQAKAKELLDIRSWSSSPFQGCWLPSDAVTALHEEFDRVPSRG